MALSKRFSVRPGSSGARVAAFFICSASIWSAREVTGLPFSCPLSSTARLTATIRKSGIARVIKLKKQANHLPWSTPICCTLPVHSVRPVSFPFTRPFRKAHSKATTITATAKAPVRVVNPGFPANSCVGKQTFCQQMAACNVPKVSTGRYGDAQTCLGSFPQHVSDCTAAVTVVPVSATGFMER